MRGVDDVASSSVSIEELASEELAGIELAGVELVRSASFPFSFHDGYAFGGVDSGVGGSWGYIVCKTMRRGMRRRDVHVQKIYSSQLGQNSWARPHKLHRRHCGGSHTGGSHEFWRWSC